MIHRCLYGSAAPSMYQPLTHALRGQHLWVVFERRPDIPPEQATPERFICLYLLGSQKGYGWGYKAVEETMGPAETGCPLSYLDMVPDPGSYSTDWRERVRKHHERRLQGTSIAQKLKPGMEVQIVRADGSQSSTVPSVVITRVGRQIRGIHNGCVYRVSRKQIGPVIPPPVAVTEQPL